ncbi:phosphoglycolate phosphatase [Halonotius terrestris]|uniref:Phosphoglycolate phosphatase n=1 Tax=Halonotius terrestris TaxID=2487750 RepID=A0A8J8TCA2_9EURY|nr:phosphoglycolate phosphatase [Halonotius terrestris]TQQ83318.1 phosphoglycolate phosphatase [Halonotius terrestris]
MVPPLALDIDGTLTTAADRIDPRVFERLPAWDAPIVIATGKSFPYPVALCHFLGIPEQVVAENGGVVCADGQVSFQGDRERAEAAIGRFRDRGGDLGWDDADTTNRWRETELAANVDADEELLRAVAAEFDLEVVDTGYAYHLKTPGVEKGDGLTAVAHLLGLDPGEFVAVGDSENDVSLFETAGDSYAVANADERAKAAAATVLEDSYFDGTLSVLDALQSD